MQKPGHSKHRIILTTAIIVFGAFFVLLIVIMLFQTRKEETVVNQTPGQVSVELGQSEREKWPIIDQLPLRNTLYTIGYTITDNQLKIYIDTTDTDLEAAIKKLATLTDQPLSNYDIDIRSPQNPFTAKFQTSSATDPLEAFTLGYQDLASKYTITSSKQDEDYCIIEFTTGSEESYNLVHWTVTLKNSPSGWAPVSDPTPTLLLDL